MAAEKATAEELARVEAELAAAEASGLAAEVKARVAVVKAFEKAAADEEVAALRRLWSKRPLVWRPRRRPLG